MTTVEEQASSPGYLPALRFRALTRIYDPLIAATTRESSFKPRVIEAADLHPGERVLDLGCAAGAVTHFLSTYACDPVGVDAEPRAIASARSLFPALRFEVADVTELPFPDRSFKKAVAADLVEHIGDVALDRMLRECVRVLVPEGTLSIYTPNPAHLIERLKARDLLLARNETHIGLRGSRELGNALRRAGFEVERDEWRASFMPPLRSVERLGGGAVAALRYRLCLRGRKAV